MREGKAVALIWREAMADLRSPEVLFPGFYFPYCYDGTRPYFFKERVELPELLTHKLQKGEDLAKGKWHVFEGDDKLVVFKGRGGDWMYFKVSIKDTIAGVKLT